jgi:hypothetical protein
LLCIFELCRYAAKTKVNHFLHKIIFSFLHIIECCWCSLYLL